MSLQYCDGLCDTSSARAHQDQTESVGHHTAGPSEVRGSPMS